MGFEPRNDRESMYTALVTPKNSYVMHLQAY